MTRAWTLRTATACDDLGGWRVDELEAPALTPTGAQIAIAVEAAVVHPVDLQHAARAGERVIPGHAAVGRVVATGEQARELEGRRVVIGRHQPCGECDVCRRGGAMVCPTGVDLGASARGTLGEHALAWARWALPLDGALTLPGPAAALIGGDAVLAYALYARAGVGPREPTVILGGGVLARFLVQILVGKGAPPVVIVDEDEPPAWTSWLETTGATVAIASDNATHPDVRDTARVALEARGHGVRPWTVFDTTGEAAQQRRALAIAGPAAVVVLAAPRATGRALPTLVGSPPPPSVAVDLAEATDRHVTVLGVAGAHPDLLVDVAALVARGELDVAGAAEVVAPAQLEAALARRTTMPEPTGLVVAIA